jgi:predicted nucleotidyltransferase
MKFLADECLQGAALVPKELLDAVVAHFDPLRVILFGSRARGEAGVDSDIDLLVVLDDAAPADKLGWRSAFEARKHFHRAVDIVPCRRSWFEDKREVIGSLAHMATENGVVIYERR